MDIRGQELTGTSCYMYCFFLILVIFLAGSCETPSEITKTDQDKEKKKGAIPSTKPSTTTKTNSSTSSSTVPPATTTTIPPSTSPSTTLPATLDNGAKNLLKQQQDNFDRIIQELQADKKKTSHWIWWVFPTDLPGRNEPEPKSSVALNQAENVIAHADMEKRAKILETIAFLLENNLIAANPTKPNSAIIPDIDHGRIGFALDFWLRAVHEKIKKHDRFYRALKRIDQFKWR